MSELTIPYAPLVRVKGDAPWSFVFGLQYGPGDLEGDAYPYPDGWTAGAQITIVPTGAVISLGSPTIAVPEIASWLFEIAPAAYAAVPLGQLSRVTAWLTDGTISRTHWLRDIQVISR